MRILVVDDEEEWQLILERVLLGEGHEVSVAGSAQAALDLARRAPPEALLMDLTLPDMRGADFLARLRGLAGLAELPVVVLSGHHARDVDTKSLSGARYVSKDQGIDAILAAVRGLKGN